MIAPPPVQISLKDHLFDAEPFPHTVTPRALDDEVAEEIREELDRHPSWDLREQAGFYRTYQADLSEVDGSSRLASLSSPSVLASVREQVAAAFATSLEEHVDFSILRWTEGCGIGPHSDFPGGQSHRLLVSLPTPGWEASQGGILVLLEDENSSQHSDLQRYYLPRSGSAVCFEISERSYHRVTKVEHGVRYTLRYAFYASSRRSD